MGSFNDLSGETFHRLTAIHRVPNRGYHTMWRALCECGNIVDLRAQHLRNGNTKSCGCWDAEVLMARNTKHGMCDSGAYRSWAAMHQRCSNPANKEWPNYGGRGIKVCKRWKDFAKFLADMGERPNGLTLDRKNNSLGYSPRNCRWATAQEQANNKRGLRFISFEGQRRTLTSWSKQFGIYPSKLFKRAARYGDHAAISHFMSKV